MRFKMMLTAALMCSGSVAVGAEKTLTVAADGSGDFQTVQAAVNAAPVGNTERVVIRIKPGTYKEQIFVPREKPLISFIGEDTEKTVLTFDLNAHSIGPDGKAVGSGGSYSTRVDASDFLAENVTFENSAGNTGQALAISVTGDRATFHRCRFLGWQDTIYSDYGRQYFHDCYIAGHVDFIFGGGTAVFENCHLHCLADGYVTAASTDQTRAHGYVFRDCRVTAADGAKAIHLGRPWRAYASVSFLNTELCEAIVPQGWNNWGNPENEKTARFSEFESQGPGANPQARAPWSRQLSQEEADAMTAQAILSGADGWDPTK